MKTPSAWSDLAWQGLGMRLPPDWNPLEVTGNRAKGALRIGNLHETTIELIWRTPGWRDDDRRVWKRYLKQAGLAARSAPDRLSDRPALANGLRDGGWLTPRVVCLDHDGDKSIHALARAPVSGRFVALRIPLPSDADESELVAPILSAIGESDRQEQETWSIYGWTVRVPIHSKMNHARLRSGHLSLRFRCRRLQIRWERISFGRRTTGGQSLSDWLFQRANGKDRHPAWRRGPAARRGGCTLERPAWRAWRPLPTSWLSAGRSGAWHVDGPDQLVVLTLDGPASRIDREFSILSESWKTHPD